MLSPITSSWTLEKFTKHTLHLMETRYFALYKFKSGHDLKALMIILRLKTLQKSKVNKHLKKCGKLKMNLFIFFNHSFYVYFLNWCKQWGKISPINRERDVNDTLKLFSRTWHMNSFFCVFHFSFTCIKTNCISKKRPLV